MSMVFEREEVEDLDWWGCRGERGRIGG